MTGTIESLEQELPNYLHQIKNKNSEEAKKQYCISSLFEKIFGVASEDLDFEVPTKTVSKLRGRADTLFQNIIFEWKQDTKNSKAIDDGEIELKKYFQHFLEKEPLQKYIGIITDGVIFKPYLPIIEKNKVTGLSMTNELNISKTLPEDIFYWFDTYFYKSKKIKLTSKSIKMQFGLDSPTFVIIRNELKNLFEKVQDYRDVKLKFDNWTGYLEIVYGEKQKEENLFFKHTYLSTLVKLLVHLKISPGGSMNADYIPSILRGKRFVESGIINFAEEDFFTWPMNIAIRKQSSQIFLKLLLELERFDIDAIDEDVLKDLYQELVDPEVRKLLGEFYTPDWLAEKMIIETLDADPLKSVLDPACGSGTFLFKTIKFKIEKLTKKGMKKSEILKHITENVFGFDIHPLAAIISKTNYLLALRDLFSSRSGQISVPVFLSDSVKIPTMPAQQTMTSYGVNVLQFEATLDKKFFFPEYIANDMVKMDETIQNLREYGSALYQNLEQIREKNYTISEDEVISNLLTNYEVSIKNIQDSNVKRILLENAKVLFELIRNKSDSIWPYILRNMYRPISLTHKKVDLIIGNPPWIALQAMHNEIYQKYLKKMSFEYDLVDKKKVHNIPNMELASLFFCHCVNKYLDKNGTIAFVMPRSVLDAAQHEMFRKFEHPLVKLKLIYDLKKVKPLFRIPSCVLIASNNSKTKYPVLSKAFLGNLPSSNCQLSEAKRFLEIKNDKFIPVTRIKKNSYYHKFFAKGADLIPRNFWFVEIKTDSFLGFNPQNPHIETAENKSTHRPWNDVKLEGNVSKEFLFNTLLATNLVPFGTLQRRLVFLPIFIKGDKVEMVSSSKQSEIIQTDTSNYLEKVEKEWKKLSTGSASKMSTYEWINYQGKLTRQKFNVKFRVLYAGIGTYMTSCVIELQKKYRFKINNATFDSNRFFADSGTYYYDTDSEEDAYYLASILNSKTLDDLIKPEQSKGSFGPRNIAKLPLTFPIPQFDPKNIEHKKLVKLGRTCHEKVRVFLPTINLKSTGKIRSVIRKFLEKEYKEIDENVKAILED